MKRYTLKTNLPGNYKKGDYVILDGANCFWEKTGKTCIFDVNEQEFFELCIPPKFKINDSVRRDNVFGVVKNVKPVSNRYTYDVLINGKTCNYPESSLILSSDYWFISSSGVIHADHEMNDYKTRYRKASGNFFASKELAKEKLNSILKEPSWHELIQSISKGQTL